MNQPKEKEIIQADPMIEKLVAAEFQRLTASIMAQVQVTLPQLVATITFYLSEQERLKVEAAKKPTEEKPEVVKGDEDGKK